MVVGDRHRVGQQGLNISALGYGIGGIPLLRLALRHADAPNPRADAQ